MSQCIADADRLRSATDGRRVECANRFRMSAGSILGDVHNRHGFAYCKRHSVFRQFQELVEGPVLRKKTYGGRTNEGASFDWNTNPLGNFNNGQNIVSMSTGSTIRPDLQFLLGDLTSH